MPALQALAEGYDVFIVTDASGGVTAEAHDMAVRRMVAAGAVPITATSRGSRRRRRLKRNSWIRREGKGRIFYKGHGHNEKVYAVTPILEHVLLGMQYVLGDLEADDRPSVKAGSHDD